MELHLLQPMVSRLALALDLIAGAAVVVVLLHFHFQLHWIQLLLQQKLPRRRQLVRTFPELGGF